MDCFFCGQRLSQRQMQQLPILRICCTNDYTCFHCLYSPSIAQQHYFYGQSIQCPICKNNIDSEDFFRRRLQINLGTYSNKNFKYGLSAFMARQPRKMYEDRQTFFLNGSIKFPLLKRQTDVFTTTSQKFPVSCFSNEKIFTKTEKMEFQHQVNEVRQNIEKMDITNPQESEYTNNQSIRRQQEIQLLKVSRINRNQSERLSNPSWTYTDSFSYCPYSVASTSYKLPRKEPISRANFFYR